MKEIEIQVPNSVDRVEFYYKGDDLVDNAFTVCMLLGEDGTLLSRGVSICSPEEPHCKGVARLYSFGRAIKALKNETTGGFINSEQRWDGEYVQRKRKLKGSNEYLNFLDILNSNKIGWKIIFDNEDIKIVHFKIPRNYSISMAKKYFDFKYDYLPTPHEYEINFYSAKGK